MVILNLNFSLLSYSLFSGHNGNLPLHRETEAERLLAKQERDTLQKPVWLFFGEIEMENPRKYPFFQNILMTPILDKIYLFRLVLEILIH